MDSFNKKTLKTSRGYTYTYYTADGETSLPTLLFLHGWPDHAAMWLDRVVGLVNLNFGYYPPSRETRSVDSMNAMAQQFFGYPAFAYWHVFAAPDGPAVLKKNVERVFHVMHGEGDTMRKFFCTPNAMREYLETGNAEIKLRPYAQDPEFKKTFIDRMTRDGFEGSQCWYRATVTGLQFECDSKLPSHLDKIDLPVLFVGAKDDAVCRQEALYPSIQAGFLPKLEQAEMIDASHWVPYEKPEEIVSRIEPWLKKNFAK